MDTSILASTGVIWALEGFVSRWAGFIVRRRSPTLAEKRSTREITQVQASSSCETSFLFVAGRLRPVIHITSSYKAQQRFARTWSAAQSATGSNRKEINVRDEKQFALQNPGGG